MKVYKKSFKDLFFELGLENIDDLWVSSLFISENDLVGNQTTRRFRIPGSDDSEKKSVFINLSVKTIKLDLNLQTLKLIGLIESGFPQQYVNVGEHHSFDLHVGDKYTIKKPILLDMQKKLLLKSIDTKSKDSIYLVVLDDDSCVIARLDESRYEVITEISFKGSGKRDTSVRQASRDQYYISILKVITSANPDKVIVGGPGFEKEYLQKYILEKQPKEIQSKFTFTQASSPGISGIRELISGGQVKKVMSDLTVYRDSELINEFLLHISKDKPATYGLIQVKESLDKNALKLVLISDKFFHDNFNEIKNLLFIFEDKKIEYHIINSATEPGTILDNMSGVAAFLYY
jgi:protein pelota